MTLRWTLLAVLLLAATPLNAKTPARPRHHAKRAAKKKAPTLTWEKLAERVIKEGIDRPFTAPAARNLGYGMDSVPAKAARFEKSHTPDHQEHAIYVVYSSDKSGLHPKELIIDTIDLTTRDGVRFVAGYFIRFKPDSSLISAVRTSGEVGKVVQTVVPVTSKFVKARFADERNIFLEKMAGQPFDL